MHKEYKWCRVDYSDSERDYPMVPHVEQELDYVGLSPAMRQQVALLDAAFPADAFPEPNFRGYTPELHGVGVKQFLLRDHVIYWLDMEYKLPVT